MSKWAFDLSALKTFRDSFCSQEGKFPERVAQIICMEYSKRALNCMKLQTFPTSATEGKNQEVNFLGKSFIWKVISHAMELCLPRISERSTYCIQISSFENKQIALSWSPWFCFAERILMQSMPGNHNNLKWLSKGLPGDFHEILSFVRSGS